MRKRSWISLFGICLTLIMAAGIIALAEGETTPTNYVTNGDFETGEYIPWTAYDAKLELVTDDVHGGKYACKAYFNVEWGGGHYLTFRAPKGKYHVSMWIKCGPDLGGGAWVGVENSTKSEKYGPNGTVGKVGEWTEIAFDVSMKSTTITVWTWAGKNTSAGAWLLLDDVSYTPR